MEFVVKGKQIRLHGDPSLARSACGQADLNSLELGDDARLLWALEDEGAVSSGVDVEQVLVQRKG